MQRLVVAALVLVAGCGKKSQPAGFTTVDEPVSVRRNVDILYMIDNSLGTSPKINEVRNRFPELVNRLQQLALDGEPASYHIGVVDSDMGAGLNTANCKAGGDGGKLRTGPNTMGSVPPPADCQGFALGNGDAFIDYDTIRGTSNTDPLDVTSAFECISAVGDMGCGFEAPLEAVYTVLAKPDVNPGFLRDDSLVAVLLMTDEDDCSAPPDTTLFENTSAATAMYGVLDSFRCTRWGIECDGMPLTGDALAPTTDCAPVVGGPLFDVSRYQQLLAPGGLRRHAEDLVFATIVAPPAPFGVTVTTPCSDQTNAPSCPILEPSCVNPQNQNFFADPAVRIAAVSSAVPGAVVGSVCDTDYTPTVDAFADAIGARLTPGCLGGTVADLAAPDCTVTVDGAAVSRCAAPGSAGCWELVDDGGCAARSGPTGAAQQLRLVVNGLDPNATVTASCRVQEPST
jgi:hypothetical protein